MLLFCSNIKCSSEFNIISNTSLELRSKQPFDFDTALRYSVYRLYLSFSTAPIDVTIHYLLPCSGKI